LYHHAKMEEKLKILRLLKAKLIENFGDNIVNVILFGSQAKGTAHVDSDYDILIVLRNDYDWKYKNMIYKICSHFTIEYDLFFDLLIINLYELNHTLRGVQPIFSNALNEGVFI
jgi:uncharacterized protein